MICAFGKCLAYTDAIWLALGFFGQTVFFMRWVVQWLASERSAASRVPIAFWYLSLAGGLITLAYAVHIKDPVFIAGQSVGTFVYLRNLMLIYRGSDDSSGKPSAGSQTVPQAIRDRRKGDG
jgi:lipid-A-disaccharide synthase-like uncharacterized protein